MGYYPVFLNVQGRKCCVVGGGSVAERKARTLVSCGARVWVVSPRLTVGLRRMASSGKVIVKRSAYRTGLIAGAFVVVAATDDRAVNGTVARDCRTRGILVNVVDVPLESTFIVPSVLTKKGLTIAVSTGGKAPCVAKELRKELSRTVLERYSRMLTVISAARRDLTSVCPSVSRRRAALQSLIRSHTRQHARIKRHSRATPHSLL